MSEPSWHQMKSGDWKLVVPGRRWAVAGVWKTWRNGYAWSVAGSRRGGYGPSLAATKFIAFYQTSRRLSP